MICKFCGLSSSRDIRNAASLGADFYGIIFDPASSRYVNPEIAAGLPKVHSLRVGVFTTHDLTEIMDIIKIAKLDLVQLHGHQESSLAQAIGPERVIRVLWPANYSSLSSLEEAAENYSQGCSWYLLDAGSSGGGKGQTLDWKNLAKIKLPHPWLLAGGLNPDNLSCALSQCNPDGVDLNSGVELSPGVKSYAKMKRSMKVIK